MPCFRKVTTVGGGPRSNGTKSSSKSSNSRPPASRSAASSSLSQIVSGVMNRSRSTRTNDQSSASEKSFTPNNATSDPATSSSKVSFSSQTPNVTVITRKPRQQAAQAIPDEPLQPTSPPLKPKAAKKSILKSSAPLSPTESAPSHSNSTPRRVAVFDQSDSDDSPAPLPKSSNKFSLASQDVVLHTLQPISHPQSHPSSSKRDNKAKDIKTSLRRHNSPPPPSKPSPKQLLSKQKHSSKKSSDALPRERDLEPGFYSAADLADGKTQSTMKQPTKPRTPVETQDDNSDFDYLEAESDDIDDGDQEDADLDLDDDDDDDDDEGFLDDDEDDDLLDDGSDTEESENDGFIDDLDDQLPRRPRLSSSPQLSIHANLARSFSPKDVSSDVSISLPNTKRACIPALVTTFSDINGTPQIATGPLATKSPTAAAAAAAAIASVPLLRKGISSNASKRNLEEIAQRVAAYTGGAKPDGSVTVHVYYPQNSSQTASGSLVPPEPTSLPLQVPCFTTDTFSSLNETQQTNPLLFPHLLPLYTSFEFICQSEIQHRNLYHVLPPSIGSDCGLILSSNATATSHDSGFGTPTYYRMVLFQEEIVRAHHLVNLARKFKTTFPMLKDNKFNNFEQWAMHNLSPVASSLPHILPSQQHRLLLTQGLASGRILPTCLVAPTAFSPNIAQSGGSSNSGNQPSPLNDILLGTVDNAQHNIIISRALSLRDCDAKTCQALLAIFAKRDLSPVLTKIKESQNTIAQRGRVGSGLESIKISEVVSPKLLQRDVQDIYRNIRRFYGVSINFITSAGTISLSIPHVVKLIILYFASMCLRHCIPDASLQSLMSSSASTPSSGSNLSITPSSTIDTVKSRLLSIFSVNSALSTSNSRLSVPVAHCLARFQSRLPSQSLLYQYISMLLTGHVVTPKLASLKSASTTFTLTSAFPQSLAQAIAAMALRYDNLHGGGLSSSSFNGGGNQAAVPPFFLHAAHDLFNVSVEGFASPFNSFFDSFCSAFADTDVAFGSLGSFFQFTPRFGNIFVNPPFVPEVILAALIHAEQLLACSENAKNIGDIKITNQQQQQNEDDGLMFVFVFPYKPQELYTKWALSSPYCTCYSILPERAHIYSVGQQQYVASKCAPHAYKPARHPSLLLFMQNKQSKQQKPITLSHLSILLRHFLVQPRPMTSSSCGSGQ